MRAIWITFCTLLMLAAISLPSIGPLVDHHFAERLPGHDHVHDGPAHVHKYQLTHDHAGGSHLPVLTFAVALLDHDGDQSTSVTMADTSLQSVSPLHGPTALFTLPASGFVTERGVSHPPPVKPPRIAG